MLELLTFVVFVWLFINVLKLIFKIAWSLVKLIAVLLVLASLPTLLAGLLFAGGALLLVPVALVGSAWGLLKACA